jgi:hypothetical protein
MDRGAVEVGRGKAEGEEKKVAQLHLLDIFFPTRLVSCFTLPKKGESYLYREESHIFLYAGKLQSPFAVPGLAGFKPKFPPKGGTTDNLADILLLYAVSLPILLENIT